MVVGYKHAADLRSPVKIFDLSLLGVSFLTRERLGVRGMAAFVGRAASVGSGETELDDLVAELADSGLRGRLVPVEVVDV